MNPTQEHIAEVQRQIKVMQDWCDGKQLEGRDSKGNWVLLEDPPTINYRTKPEPRRFWIYMGNDSCLAPFYTTFEEPKHKAGYVEGIEVLP